MSKSSNVLNFLIRKVKFSLFVRKHRAKFCLFEYNRVAINDDNTYKRIGSLHELIFFNIVFWLYVWKPEEKKRIIKY